VIFDTALNRFLEEATAAVVELRAELKARRQRAQNEEREYELARTGRDPIRGPFHVRPDSDFRGADAAPYCSLCGCPTRGNQIHRQRKDTGGWERYDSVSEAEFVLVYVPPA